IGGIGAQYGHFLAEFCLCFCDAFGVAFAVQHRNITTNKRWCCHHMVTTGADGKNYQMLTLPLRQVPAFMNSINSNKVKPEAQQSLRNYQDECTEALYAYWMTGKAEQQTLSVQMAFQIADTLAVFKEEYPAIYGKPADAVPHSGMYAMIQTALNQSVCGADRLPEGLARQVLPHAALKRLKDAGQMLRKAFIRGAKLKEATKQLRAAFSEPVLRIEIKVEVVG
ncbi:MAG: phage antirepressor N-terminal domain-containing protein, partial [Burkholderiales bacterium]|nr:phage antirepressor N-terminal domain-containing protein [Burkholderiales bacterium]